MASVRSLRELAGWNHVVVGGLLAALLVGCGGGAPPLLIETDRAAHSIHELLRQEYRATLRRLPETPQQVIGWAEFSCVVVLVHEPGAPVGGMDEATRTAIRHYVEHGGRLLLLGFASQLAVDLRVEPEPPSRVETVYWGDDDRTAIGLYQYGFSTIDDIDRLTPELRAFPRHPNSFLIGGGEGVAAQTVEWDAASLRAGEVLGESCRLRDDEFAEPRAAVLVRWDVGDGSILACGVVPEPFRPEPAIAENARQFLRNAMDRLLRDAADENVALCVAPTPSETMPDRDFVLPPLAAREVPGAVAIPHWGWQVAVNHLREGRAPVAPKRVYDEVLVPSFRAGASLLDLQLADSREGYPFAWSPRDPIAQPANWRGGDFWPGWTQRQVALLANEAHHRGMLLQCWLHPAPVGGTALRDREFVDATKWFGRELADVRRLGVGAVDGLGVHRWFRDDAVGVTASVLRTFHPGLHGYHTAPRSHPVSAFVAAVDAARGRPAGVPPQGISSQWRDDYPAAGYPFALLDCRERMPSRGEWGGDAERGGGSYADWLVTQVGDFARPRAHQGGAMWWGAHNPATLGAATLEYVHGLSLDPMKAAVAGRFTATGRDGFRAQCARLLGRVQGGFGAESELPASTPFLQNNHIRLCGSAGPLWFDATGTALFRDGADRRRAAASQSFMTTHVRGFRPSVDSIRSAVIDLIGAQPRGAGGFADTLRISGAERGGVRFPAVLARDRAPEWPARVESEFHVSRGGYELELALVGRDGDGIVEVRVDDEVTKFFTFYSGDGVRHHAVPVQLAHDGDHRLSLAVVHGGAVGVSICRLSRVDDRAAQSRVRRRAGHCAELVESSSSTYFSEDVELRTIADLPGFIMRATCRAAVRNVQVVRKFGLDAYTGVTRSRESSRSMTGPFVLESGRRGLPDLAVVPIDVPPAFRFTTENGSLELVTYPRPHQEFRVGFVFLRDHRARDLDELVTVCRAVSDPTVVRLESGASAKLPAQLDIPWPRLVRVYNPERTPFMVREGRTWSFRGGQPVGDADGAQWLRVYHRPGADVEIVAWDAEQVPMRPGPGSLHSVAMRDVTANSAEVEVLQTGPMLAAPSVEFAQAFDRVTLNGEPWAFVEGSRVLLPHEPGRYRVSTRVLGRASEPRLLRTRAIVRRASFDPDTRVLELFTVRRPEDAEGTAYTAWLSGGEPTDVVGERAVRVPEDTFEYADADTRNAAQARGVIVRFEPGLLRVRYP